MEKIQQLLPKLDQKTILDILTKAAEDHADVRANISTAISKKREAEARRAINFDYYSKDVWKEINITHSKESGSRQYDASWDVYESVEETIEKIAKQCGPLASPQTRYNGLSVLRKIGKTICFSDNDVVESEVQKAFQRWPTPLETAMGQIISCMKIEERRAIRSDESHSEALYPKLLELRSLTEGLHVFEGLDDVFELLEEGLYEDDFGHFHCDTEYESDEDEDEEIEDNKLAPIPGISHWDTNASVTPR